MPLVAQALLAAGAPAGARDALDAFVELFVRWNARINLSAARDPAALGEHIADCLHVTPHLRGAEHVLDVGSGGGLPVVVAAIVCPSVRFTALEPVHKKHAFLRTAAQKLGLANLEAHARRLDDHPQRDYDVAMSRATFDLREWIELGLDWVRPGGSVLAMEGQRRDDLPVSWERHAYELGGKQRAIIIARRSET